MFLGYKLVTDFSFTKFIEKTIVQANLNEILKKNELDGRK